MPTVRSGKLPFVFINVATTADGKIAPASRNFVPFGSKRDFQLLLRLRATADAVMSGARTVDSMALNLGPGPKKYRRMRLNNGLAEYNLRVIVSGSASIDPSAEIFRHTFSPIIILVTDKAPRRKVERLRQLGAHVVAFGKKDLDFRAALRWLRERWGVKRLLCEGGGEVNAALIQEGLVDRVYQTICPILFGGASAPTLADGEGFERLAGATTLRPHSRRRHGDELYLAWDVAKNDQPARRKSVFDGG